MLPPREIRADSIRGWIAIGLVALGGLAASLHSYYAGRADSLVLQARVDALQIDVVAAQSHIVTMTSDITRLKTLHEQRGKKRRR